MEQGYATPEKVETWAAMFKVSRRTMLRWLKAQAIPARKCGKFWQIRVDAVPVNIQAENLISDKPHCAAVAKFSDYRNSEAPYRQSFGCH